VVAVEGAEGVEHRGFDGIGVDVGDVALVGVVPGAVEAGVLAVALGLAVGAGTDHGLVALRAPHLAGELVVRVVGGAVTVVLTPSSQDLLDLVRAYSKRYDLLDELDRATRRLARALAADPVGEPLSVRSTGRVGRAWALTDRLSEDEMREIARSFEAGISKDRLGERYGISRSSIQRILRKYRKEAHNT
jgi:hypothetical protein